MTITPPCAVESPILAAGRPPIITDPEPVTMVSGGPAQVAISPSLAAGRPPINTVGSPGGKMGPPTCGVPPGVSIGQTCVSVILAANGMAHQLIFTRLPFIFTIDPSKSAVALLFRLNPAEASRLIFISAFRAISGAERFIFDPPFIEISC